MRINERFDLLEEKVRQLEKELCALKAADAPKQAETAAGEQKEAGTAKKARTAKAKKAAEG